MIQQSQPSLTLNNTSALDMMEMRDNIGGLESRLNVTALNGADSSLNNLVLAGDYTSNPANQTGGGNGSYLKNLSASGLSIIADKVEDPANY